MQESEEKPGKTRVFDDDLEVAIWIYRFIEGRNPSTHSGRLMVFRDIEHEIASNARVRDRSK
jgi:hypothetical protein